MSNIFKKVKDFHIAFNIPNADKPSLPNDKERDLRKRLLKEEFEEYLEGEQNNDLIEIADALGDMVYVILGTALSYGIPLDKVLDEIHKSNMSKLDENGNPIKNEVGKVVKSKLFFVPDIKSILDANKPFEEFFGEPVYIAVGVEKCSIYYYILDENNFNLVFDSNDPYGEILKLIENKTISDDVKITWEEVKDTIKNRPIVAMESFCVW